MCTDTNICFPTEIKVEQEQEQEQDLFGDHESSDCDDIEDTV